MVDRVVPAPSPPPVQPPQPPAQPPQPPTQPPSSSPITAENRLPGSNHWQIPRSGDYRVANDRDLQIAAFASQVSHKVGDDLALHVSVTGGRSFSVEIMRLGWYGGAGGRVVRSIDERQGTTQQSCTHPDSVGMVECPWSVTLREHVSSDWVSGVYVAVLTTNDRFQAAVPFVVRDDREATFVHVSPFNTYSAYNNFPDSTPDARSFYTAPATTKVSLDRPWSYLTGYKQFRLYEIPVIQFLERAGYDVTYAADPDIDADASRLVAGHKGVIYSSHPEYWTRTQRAAALNARDQGRGLAFIAANISHWPVRYEPGSDGTPRRHIVGYLDNGPDPNVAERTDRRYHQLPDMAEQLFVGGQYVAGAYVDDEASQSLAVGSDTSHWAFAGTGFVPGQTIPGAYVGYEADSVDSRFPLPANATVLMASPFVGAGGVRITHRSVIIEHPGAGIVFNTGSMAWAWALSPRFAGHASAEQAGIKRLTTNVLDRIAAS